MEKPKKEISIRDISRLSGVSIATVSRVINNNGHYSKETERRVLEIIEAYHYAPNLTARRLRTREQNFVAIIVPDITNEFFARICQQLQEGLRANGYLALLCNTAENMETQQQYLNMLGIVNLAGIIYVAGNSDIDSEYSNKRIPSIYIDRTPHEQALEHSVVVDSDNYGGAVMSVKLLHEKGCRRIIMMRSISPISTHDSRQKGFVDEMERCGLAVSPEQIVKVDDVNFEIARQKTIELIQAGNVFDGVFCATDWLASGVVAALDELKIDVPGQVKVIGFDDISIARLSAKPITTIHQDIELISKTAVEQIIRIISGEETDIHHLQIDVSLVQRKTT